MIRSIYFMLLLLLSNGMIGRCQTNERDSLRRILTKSGEDTTRVLLLSQLGFTYRFSKPDSCILLTEQALLLARKLKFPKGEVRALNTIGESLRSQGNFPKALEMELEALRISKTNHDQEGEAMSLIYMGIVYVEMSEYRQSLNYFHQGIKILETLKVKRLVSFGLSNIGNAYEKMNRLDSALFFQERAYAMAKESTVLALKSLVLTRLGIVHSRLGNYNQALGYYKEALRNTYLAGDLSNRSGSQFRIAELFLKTNQPDSSIHFARLAFNSGQGAAQKTVLDASNLLSTLYKAKNQFDSAFHYKELAMAAKDSLFGPEKFRQLQLLIVSEQSRQQKILQDQVNYENKIKLYSLLATTAVVFLIAVILYRNNREKQKANTMLQHQKNEVQSTLTDLKATQSLLIQSEKMASLGELTAGIAHEIQNPLNFVNNFSEVNMELLTEMKSELDKGNAAEAKVIANDIIENQQKINHHGTRAGSIVRGMLQHSRSSTGQKELTDINVLAEEYSRLAYHGFRAKDKTFNVSLKTNFDSAMTSVNIIPQDIGRVILNLITNAFYAVAEKGKLKVDDPLAGQAGPPADLSARNEVQAEPSTKADYEPTVTLSTRAMQDRVEIRVKDNGNGIPKKALDKIFQPFFTTKPTGQGTGLGLSLSYDIMKAHGGELKVETKEGEGAEFIVVLPSDKNV